MTQDYLVGEMHRAEREQYDAAVILMDTPGGLASSMREIVKELLDLEIPGIVYVSPPGSSAGLRRCGHRRGRRRARDGAADEHRLLDADLARR